MKEAEDCDSYKYLGVTCVDGTKHHKMKVKVKIDE